ncbi:MAG: FAD-dependent oxidoreductase [Spirochaetales bacterium]|nr:FAD-dependent oxidoreductase [Spirochaetales bacterium]
MKDEKIVIVKLKNKMVKKNITGVQADISAGVLYLTGETDLLEKRVRAGYLAAKFVKNNKLAGLVVDIAVTGMKEPTMWQPTIHDDLLGSREFDVVIIGGGIIGVTAARELSRYNLSIALLEKEEDLGLHASGRNDGMIHPGMAATPGSQKARFNARGNELYNRAAEELDFSLKRPGSLLLFSSIWMTLLIPVLKQRCRKNGVPGARWMSRGKVRAVEPHLTNRQRGAFYMPSAGIVAPREVVLAYAENGTLNGVDFFFHTAVQGMKSEEDRVVEIHTNRGKIYPRVVINAAGVWADKVAELADDRYFSIHPRKGVDAILDKRSGCWVSHIAGMPSLLGAGSSHSKGGGIVPCVEGNVLLGPTAEEILDREDFSTSSKEMEDLKKHLYLNGKLRMKDIITYYAGVRAALWREDFIVERSGRVTNLIHAAGIQSPGFASAPAIAVELSKLTREAAADRGLSVVEKNNFNPIRKSSPRPAEMEPREREALIARDPAYGRIVCRCEEISEGEIRDALNSPLPAETVDGVKRRSRAGAGRCHGGFCQARVMEIIAREKGIPLNAVEKGHEGSWIVTGREESHEA